MSAARGFAVAETELESFDGRERARVSLQLPDRYRMLAALPDDVPRIARGSGVSYVGASFGGGAVSQSLAAFDRLLAFDADAGTLTVEAGARIGNVLRFALRRGWYLPVVPGHPAATIGGCLAADVHGKNPARDGTFSAHVDAIDLVDGDALVRATHDVRPELFSATAGGFGLTGAIARATLRLQRAPTAFEVERIPVRDFVDAASVMRAHADAALLYGWHDGRHGVLGRGVIRVGHAIDTTGAPPTPKSNASHDLPASIARTPIGLWNRATIALANRSLDARWRVAGRDMVQTADTLFPLNDARRYFAAFGPRGFVEAQWLIPHARFADFAAALATLVARLRPRITLISSKLFAGRASGFRFDGDGVALALHVPDPSQRRQRDFLAALSDAAITHDGRPNAIKDSSLDATTLRRALPAFDGARSALRRHDPRERFRSALSARLGL